MDWPEIFYADKHWISLCCHLDIRGEGSSSVHLHYRAVGASSCPGTFLVSPAHCSELLRSAL